MHQLTYYLKKYLQHYLICQLNQTKYYRFYNLLISIISFNLSFHTIIMNFVFSLLIYQELNIILSVINKFLKQVTLLVRKDMYIVIN